MKLQMVDDVKSSIKPEDFKLNITESAVNKLKSLLKDDLGLRILVKRGGCSGFSYMMDVGTKKEHDVHITPEGVNIYVDQDSLDMINNSTIDYVDSLQGAGFKVINPNANRTCHCGESFG